MITVKINSETKKLQPDTTVAQALESLGYQNSKIAVAINGEFVPRTHYPNTVLQANDLIDVVAPIQGG